VRLEGSGRFRKFSDLIWNRTRDLPACGIGGKFVPAPN
jgi:hypothetical protein